MAAEPAGPGGPLVVVVNPTSGGGRGARWGTSVVRLLRERQVPYHLVMGADADDASRRAGLLLSRLRTGDVTPAGVVAVGGDGMVHLCINLALDSDVPLGLVPAGTGNDFARAVGIHTGGAEQAVATIVDAMGQSDLPRVDVGALEGGPVFGCVLSAGFDATVNARANRMGRLRGRARYPVAMLAELRRFKPLDCTVTVDGVGREHRAMLVAVGNGSSYGGGMQICPDASLTDGLLDVTVVDEIGVAELLRLFPRVYSGRHLEHPKAHAYRGRSVTIQFPRDASPPVFADGEPMTTSLSDSSCTVLARPGAIRLLAPALTGP